MSESHYVGQEYIEDPEKIDILIKYIIKFPVKTDGFVFDNGPIHIRQDNNEIFVNIRKAISKKLFNDIVNLFESFRDKRDLPKDIISKNPGQYIAGYIRETLPIVNDIIIKNKYNDGQILLRTVSQFDIDLVFMVDGKGNHYSVNWPLPIPPFPLSKNNEKEIPAVFARDLMDSMTEYLYYNLDECLRKIITSLENYFIFYNLKIKQRSLLSKIFFKKISKIEKLINLYVTEEYYEYKERDLKILRENIIFIYHVRCLIVHDKLRLKTNDLMICKKAIGTLLYIYQSKLISANGQYSYLFSFDMQFKMIADMLTGVNLDFMEKISKQDTNHKNGHKKIISNTDEMNESLFRSLKITKNEKKSIKK